MKLDSQHGANAGVLASLAKRASPGTPAIAPPDSGKNPYWGQGSHPDIVERIWDQVGVNFPSEARCLLYGTPALVHPGSDVVVAVAYGTAYCLRIPAEAVREAVQAGARTTMKWAGGRVTNIQEEFGEDWIFGAWLHQEAKWRRQVYQEWERSP